MNHNIQSELDRSGLTEDEKQIYDEEEDKDPDTRENTMMETTTYNDEKIVKSPVRKTLNSPMAKNGDSEKLILNVVFYEKKNMDYIYKLLHN